MTMTIRDVYAASALQGLAANPAVTYMPVDKMATIAGDMADAMIAEACSRWGHDYGTGGCLRCDAERPPGPEIPKGHK